MILVDTGYLFPETYRFVDELTDRFSLNLKIYRPTIGIAWMEARFGRLWEQGVEGINRYNRLRKIEPMQRALDELDARTWIAGLRRSQTQARAGVEFLELRDGRWKLHPLADWTDQDVGRYLPATTCPTTRSGTRATYRSAMSTPPAAGNRACARKTPASSASSASAACTSTTRPSSARVITRVIDWLSSTQLGGVGQSALGVAFEHAAQIAAIELRRQRLQQVQRVVAQHAFARQHRPGHALGYFGGTGLDTRSASSLRPTAISASRPTPRPART